MSPLFRQADFSFPAQVTSLRVIGFLDTQNEQICWLVANTLDIISSQKFLLQITQQIVDKCLDSTNYVIKALAVSM
jgi:hypothetical protein